MRVLVVGASGTIGRAIVAELGQRHEVITAGRSSGELRTDITDSEAIRTMFEGAGSVDALVSATGKVNFAPFEDMGAEDYGIGLKDKQCRAHRRAPASQGPHIGPANHYFRRQYI